MATAEGDTLWVAELRRLWHARVLPSAASAEPLVDGGADAWRGAGGDALQGDIEFRRIWLTALPPMIERQNGTREPQPPSFDFSQLRM
jgi:hypothetical protein